MELFDRLRVMAEHLDNVGTSLGRAVDAFNDVAGSFEHRFGEVEPDDASIGVFRIEAEW